MRGKQEATKDLKVNSLDDLLEEDGPKNTAEPERPSPENHIKVDMSKIRVEQPIVEQNVKQESPKAQTITQLEEEDAPMLPQIQEDSQYDIQKEIEAKFDELFGPMDEE